VAEVLALAHPHDEGGGRMGSYASDLFVLFDCPRHYFFDRVDPIKDDRSWFVTAEEGNRLHELVVDFFKRAGRWRGDEVRGGVPELNISYRIDLLIHDGPIGEADHIVPVEIKSCNANSYHGKEYRGHPEWTRIGYKENPGWAHYLQLQAYLHFHRPEPYPYGYLFYLSKNDGEMSMWTVHYDPATGKAIEDALSSHEFNVINGLMPGPATDPEACKWCPYAARCMALGGLPEKKLDPVNQGMVDIYKSIENNETEG
jgi:CRISPR/Cas system-associated exonuclease Cas4 (RecB family)